jgi:hypothetical protein
MSDLKVESLRKQGNLYLMAEDEGLPVVTRTKKTNICPENIYVE